ncbi:hypothetical protein, partial [Streptosporangium sp. NPDC087985]|uniref:hypothetical protein n=1 Tax=Streptosporangium sp. NPDC087985 TaxID=3366196 RepID=UPI0038041E85
DRLRVLRPAFYRANVALYQEQVEFFPELFQGSPEEAFIAGEEEGLARRTLSTLLAGGRRTDRCAHHRLLLAGICRADPMSGADLVACAVRDLGIGSTAADRFIRRLVRLADRAGLDWVADQCRTADDFGSHLRDWTRRSRVAVGDGPVVEALVGGLLTWG